MLRLPTFGPASLHPVRGSVGEERWNIACAVGDADDLHGTPLGTIQDQVLADWPKQDLPVPNEILATMSGTRVSSELGTGIVQQLHHTLGSGDIVRAAMYRQISSTSLMAAGESTNRFIRAGDVHRHVS
jgi:hypothetical protein